MGLNAYIQERYFHGHEWTIGSSANHLDVTIIDEYERLTTKVDHRSTPEAYYLAYECYSNMFE